MLRLRFRGLRSLASIGVLASALALSVVACEGCKSTKPGVETTSPTDLAQVPDVGPPTARLYIVSNMAGALEPCGCTKDQLGGLDHVAAFIAGERSKVPASAVVSAGPLFFLEPDVSKDHLEQDVAKAETIARAWRLLGLVAFTPGDNDVAAGTDRLLSLARASGAPVLLSNVPAPEGAGAEWKPFIVKEIGGIKIGIIGVGAHLGEQKARTGAVEAAKNAAAEATKSGAQVLVVLAATGRGEAKRIADALPEATLIVVGDAISRGDANTKAPPGERIEGAVIAEEANHLQTLGILDLFVRDGSFHFADASGLEQAAKRDELQGRIDDLHVKIANWERDKKIPEGDLSARKADLARLEHERAALDQKPPPPSGSFFRYTVKPVREKLGKDPELVKEMGAYYKGVNERNKTLFADRLPRPAEGGEASYLGAAVCKNCHSDAYAFWKTTKHAGAYATLSTQFKEYNLDCVSCHVTGYERPGGSTVAHVEDRGLADVQCEVCHGPGSKHPAAPKDPSFIIQHPEPRTCLSCHHPPHVEQFDPGAKMAEILGPGHGAPLLKK